MNGGRWYAFLNGATRCLETQPLSDYTAALNSNYYCRRDPFVYVCVCVCVLRTNECVTFERSTESESDWKRTREREREIYVVICR